VPDRNDTSQKRPGKTNRFGRASLSLRMGTAIIAVIGSLALFAILALHIPFVQKEIIVQIEKRIETETHYRAEFTSFQWRPISALILEGLRVEAEGAPVLECEKVRVSCGLSMGSPYIEVQEIYLQKPFLHLERTADGKWRVPGRTAQSLSRAIDRAAGGSGNEPSPPPERLPFPKVRIFSGQIEARQQGKTIMTVKDVTGVLKLYAVQGPNGREIRVDLENIQAELSGDPDFAEATVVSRVFQRSGGAPATNRT